MRKAKIPSLDSSCEDVRCLVNRTALHIIETSLCVLVYLCFHHTVFTINPKPYKGFITHTRTIPLLVAEMILLQTRGSLPFSLLSLNR